MRAVVFTGPGAAPTAQRFQVGGRVFGIGGGGGLADRVVVHERHVAPVPSNLDELAAAAVPEPPLAEVEPGHLMRCHIPTEELRAAQTAEATPVRG